jgi:Fe-S cluster biogenesis protein NfuA/nitrite reductase/ring-hydroxylating ferredoxin subunit
VIEPDEMGDASLDPAAPSLAPRATGERIEALLEASAAGGPVARERAEELVRLVTDLYGAGLERLLDIVHESGHLDGELLEALAADDLVAGLLMVHGLHPYDVPTRVQRALDSVRPYLGSHGGDVELLAVTDEGVVHLQLLGSCDGCPSSAVTLELAVKDAVEAAAPEVTSIEVRAVESASVDGGGGFVPVSALRSRLLDQELGPGPGPTVSAAGWEPVPDVADLEPGELRRVDVTGMSAVVARVGSDRYAYRDRCGRCEASLSSARLERRLGGRAGDAVLTCPTCGAHFDVRRAGAGLDHADEHLEPLPLLVRDGVVSVAVPTVST